MPICSQTMVCKFRQVLPTAFIYNIDSSKTQEIKRNYDEQFKKLAPTGSRPGILYGVPKIHKTDIPLRPILSVIGTHSYNLAKFLVSLLRPLSLSSYLINNSFTFIQELVSLNLNGDHLIMASFGVKSLFTNIPLNETIQIILDQRFINSRLYHGFSRKDFE